MEGDDREAVGDDERKGKKSDADRDGLASLFPFQRAFFTRLRLSLFLETLSTRQDVPQLRVPDQGIRGRGLPDERGRARGRRRAAAGEGVLSLFFFFLSIFILIFLNCRASAVDVPDSPLSSSGERYLGATYRASKARERERSDRHPRSDAVEEEILLMPFFSSGGDDERRQTSSSLSLPSLSC